MKSAPLQELPALVGRTWEELSDPSELRVHIYYPFATCFMFVVGAAAASGCTVSGTAAIQAAAAHISWSELFPVISFK